MRRQLQNDPFNIPAGRNGRRIACRQCRQAKLRCDLSTSGTIPCSRCRRTEQDCQVDSHYQRVNKRARLETLEKEIQQLRSSVSTLAGPTSQVREKSSQFSNEVSILNSETPLHPETPLRDEFPLPTEPSTPYLTQGRQEPLVQQMPLTDSISIDTCGRSLDHFFLNPSQINSMFQRYFRLYHPYLPLLDSAVSANEYYDRSPLLFWAVIYVSARHCEDEPSMLIILTAPLKKLLWQTISTPPHTWYQVQGILLCCVWPIPASSLSTDNTLKLVTMAQTIAIQLGLHRPEVIQDFSRTKRRLNVSEISEVARTWSVCYFAGQNLYTMDESPLRLTRDWIIDQICDKENQYKVPDPIKYQVIMHRFSARVGSVMSGIIPNSSTGLPTHSESASLLALLEQEYAEFSNRISEMLSDENKILLDGVGLQLYIFYLREPNDLNSRRRGLIRVFNIAKQVLTKLEDLNLTSNLIRYGPTSYFQLAVLAAMVILKLNYSSCAKYIDTESGKRAFDLGILLLRQASLQDNDLPGRTSKILVQLWSTQEQQGRRDEEPSLKLRTRSGASLLHDSLWAWREKFGGQGSGTQTPSGTLGVAEPLSDTSLLAAADESIFDGLNVEDLFDTGIFSFMPLDLDADAIVPS